ncbi:hypothetical protein L484_018600 [Morus notabilis]|uniref:DUF7880 domain-containing protein n=1 Tax=Morus notabilis TaxID=981085 RepID=W9RHM1_9ROSA|nr:uncharacterized protein LOC21401567 [Morus notabilis]EXB74892.1 hypothetical protein L484_018600 [Morus notabilis]
MMLAMAMAMSRVGNPPHNLSVWRRNFAGKVKKCRPVTYASVSPSDWRESRRLVSISLVLSHSLLIPHHAIAGSIFDRYVKRKRLDPLDAYVPALILSQLQIKDLDKLLEGDQPQYASFRSLLRSGPAASLRVNIRAVAQYASESGNGKTAFNDVDQCLRALEELDSLLLHASRNDPEASVKSMKAKINVALDSLDGLLKTVPPDVLDKGLAIADSYRNSDEEINSDVVDPELQQLESIL